MPGAATRFGGARQLSDRRRLPGRDDRECREYLREEQRSGRDAALLECGMEVHHGLQGRHTGRCQDMTVSPTDEL